MSPAFAAELNALSPDSIERGADDAWAGGVAQDAERGEAAPASATLPRLDTPSFLVQDTDDLRFESPDTPIFDDKQVVVRIQHFSPGGFEGTCVWRSREAWLPRAWPGLSGKVDPEASHRESESRERDEEEVKRSNVRRSKRKVRYLCREIAADHLLTLTTREERNDPVGVLSRFEQFVRLYRRALGDEQFLYVAVPEPHPSNPDHWHVHVAVHGRIHVNVARKIWWSICGGQGMGNVDARWIKCRAGLNRAEKIAGYISKYVTKVFDAGLLLTGRHRYRAAKITLLDRTKLVFEAAKGLNQALDILQDRLDMLSGDMRVWFFPDGSGFWFSCSGEFAGREPPF